MCDGHRAGLRILFEPVFIPVAFASQGSMSDKITVFFSVFSVYSIIKKQILKRLICQKRRKVRMDVTVKYAVSIKQMKIFRERSCSLYLKNLFSLKPC